ELPPRPDQRFPKLMANAEGAVKKRPPAATQASRYRSIVIPPFPPRPQTIKASSGIFTALNHDDRTQISPALVRQAACFVVRDHSGQALIKGTAVLQEYLPIGPHFL